MVLVLLFDDRRYCSPQKCECLEGRELTRPQEIAYFSYDDDHQYHLDDRSLRYYWPPRLGADLSKGFDTFKQLDDTADDHLDSLLQTLMALEGETGMKCEADIITWRGMMTKVSRLHWQTRNCMLSLSDYGNTVQ